MALKNLSRQVELPIEGTDKTLRMNFADKRFLSRLLKLVNKYSRFDEDITNISNSIPETATELEKADIFLDKLVEIEEKFKADINECFGFSVTDLLFGEDSLPSIEDYADLFEQLTPYISDARKAESEKIIALQTKYGLNRVENTSATASTGIKPVEQ